MREFLATVETDRRLEVSQPTPAHWLDPADTCCVVEIVGPGQLRLWPLAVWAEKRGVTEQAAKEHIEGARAQATGPAIPRFHLAALTQARRQKGGTCTITLPETAVWYLFRPSYGPCAPKRRRRSAPVLVRHEHESLFVWGDRREGYLEGPDTSLP